MHFKWCCKYPANTDSQLLYMATEWAVFNLPSLTGVIPRMSNPKMSNPKMCNAKMSNRMLTQLVQF